MLKSVEGFFCSIYGALFEVAWALCMNKHRLPLYKICVVSCGFSLKTLGQVIWHYYQFTRVMMKKVNNKEVLEPGRLVI